MYFCETPSCAIAISKAEFPMAMNCPVCQTPLSEVVDSLSQEDMDLIDSLPYVIAYPLQQTLLEKHPPQRINLFKDTFLNYLKYLGLLSASEFFNSDIKDKGMVLLFQQNLIETAFGKWNHYIRESLKFLKEQNYILFCPELATYYELVETGNKSKKYKGEIEFIDANGDIQLKKQEATSIGMLINFRNRYLGHGLTLDAQKAEALWQEYFPIFRNLLEQLRFAKDYPMLKREDGITYLLHSSEIKTIDSNSATQSSIWIQNKEGKVMDILPFFIVPGEVSLVKEDKEQMLTYESYTGKTIKFFSPEGTEKQTSGKLLEKLNLLLRDKQKEVPFAPKEFTKEEFLNRIADENKLLLETLINEKKIIPGVYQHREEMEIKLREWIGARANIFFIAAEAGSGKTNLLAEIQKQYAERDLPSLLIRAGRMEKQSLKEQIAYLLNIDLQQGLENYSSIAGTQASPTFILIDGLNEANHADAIWQEILSLSTVFEPGSLKFVVTNRANTKADLERYLVSDKQQEFLYGENKENEKGLGAYSYWLTALDMKEMKGAWENYMAKDKARFKPQFTFDAIAEFDRGIYNQINNPLILRLFLEIYNGKALPKKGNKHLHIWSDWLKTFTEAEQTFFELLADGVWQKGENELLLDDVLNDKTLKPYFTSDVINAPYPKLKNLGWISSYTKDLTVYVAFTVEGTLLYLLGKKLLNQTPKVDLHYVQQQLQTGSKLKMAAIEAYLCEEALIGNLDLVSEFIDAEGQDVSIVITPVILFLKIFGIEATINKILENPTERDWKALLKLDEQLEELQLHVLRKAFLTAVMPQNLLNTEDSVLLGLKAIAIFDKSDAVFYLDKINTTTSFIDENHKMLFQLGECESKLGNYDKALEYYEKSLAIGLKTLGDEHPDMVTSYNNIGSIWYNKGEYDKSLVYYEKCLKIRLKTLGDEHPDVARSYNNIGVIWKNKSEYDKALEYYEKCLKIQLKTLGDEHPDVSNSYNNNGLFWCNKGEYDKGLEYYEKCLKIRLKTLGYEHPDVSRSYNNIGSIWKSKCEYDKALEYYEKCLKIQLKTLGDEHPDMVTSYYNIGSIWKSKCEYDKALEYYEKCLKIQLKTLGDEHPDVARSYNNIGVIRKNKSEYDKALEYYEKSLAIKLKTLGDEHPDVARSYNNIGVIWKNKSEYDKALEYYEKCLKIKLKTLGDAHPDVANTYFDIGTVNKNLSNFVIAIENFKKGYEIEQKGVYTFNIAQCYEALNQPSEALEYYIQCAEIRKDDIGLEHKATQEAITNANRLAKESGRDEELPEWMK
jgi:tetratricopeptide (TPR) repeat protein